MDNFSNFVEIQKLKKELSAKSGNLVRYVVSHVAETDGQTLFPIELSTFNFRTDSVWVVSGRTMLSAARDYVVQSQSIVLNEGVPAGRTVDIYVYKNVVNLDKEQKISGLQIAEGSLPLDRLAENLTAEQVGAVPKSIMYSNKDLNELVADGHYFVSGTLTETNVFHLPDEYYRIMSSYGSGKYFEFQLITFAIGTRCCQIGVTPYNGEANSFGRMWYRIGTGSSTISSWTDWKEIFTSEHPPTAEQVGAAEKYHTHDICLIKHDTTGALYRIGLDDTGLYYVPYSL